MSSPNDFAFLFSYLNDQSKKPALQPVVDDIQTTVSSLMNPIIQVLYPDYELELRFGFQLSTFIPGLLSFTEFYNLKMGLDEISYRNPEIGLVKVKNTIDLVELYEIGKHRVRKINLSDSNFIIQEKFQPPNDSMATDRKLGLRVSKAKEIPFLEPLDGPIIGTRSRERFIYATVNRGPYYGLEIDLTIVTSDKGERSFEVEIERRDTSYDKLSLLTSFGNMTSLIFQISQDCEVKNIITMEEKRIAFRSFNMLFSMSGDDKIEPIKFYYKPVSLKMGLVLSKERDEYYSSAKLDGLRRFILIKGNIYHLYPPRECYLLERGDFSKWDGTLIEGEYMWESDGSSAIFCFDILFLQGQDQRKKRFSQRYSALKDIIASLNISRLKSKMFYGKSYGSFYERNEQVFKEFPDENLEGIILQRDSQYDAKGSTYKWKKKKRITIDFFLLPEFDDKKRKYYIPEVYTKSHESEDFVQFRNFKMYPEKDKLNEFSLDNQIVECGYNYINQEFYPVKIRSDKMIPNHQGVAEDTYKQILQPVEEGTMNGTSFQVLRKFNNQYKALIIKNNIEQDTLVLDIGFGRGGDLKKYKEVGITKVYGVEPNTRNAQIMINRLAEMDFGSKVQLIEAGGEDTKIILSQVKSVDYVVSFFSLTFFPKNREMYYGLLNTIDSILDVGGTFLAITLEGTLVTSTNNQSFEIRKGKVEPCILGNKIWVDIKDPDAIVHNQEEYLFYLKPFKVMLEIMGFEMTKLVELSSLSTHSLLPVESQRYNAMSISFVFTRKKKRIEGVHPYIKSLGNLKLEEVNEIEVRRGEHNVLVINEFYLSEEIYDHEKIGTEVYRRVNDSYQRVTRDEKRVFEEGDEMIGKMKNFSFRE
jgi:SAM-dependent methyltransferase